MQHPTLQAPNEYLNPEPEKVAGTSVKICVISRDFELGVYAKMSVSTTIIWNEDERYGYSIHRINQFYSYGDNRDSQKKLGYAESITFRNEL